LRHPPSRGYRQSWRANRQNDYDAYLEDCEAFEQGEREQPPVWCEPSTPQLRAISIQANSNVALLQAPSDSTFDYWLRVSTLKKRDTLWLPVKLADYHREALAGKCVNRSVLLQRRDDGWWLTLSYHKHVKVKTPLRAPKIGVDVGIASFLTTSDGKHY
jgi:hypothetical protein